MGYGRFSAEIFSCPFLVVKAALAAPVGRASLSMPPAQSAADPQSTSEVFSFNPSPVVRQPKALPS